VTHIKEGVEDKFDIVVDHGPDGDRYEVGVIQNSRCVVGSRLGRWSIRVVDDLDGVVEDKIIRNDIIPDDKPKSNRVVKDLHVFTLSDR
jgi:hypothetical protein